MATSTYKKEVEMFADMTEGSVHILIDYPIIGTEGQLPLPPTVRDCLTKHPCLWKFISKNSLSVPPGCCGGTTTDRLGALDPEKVDNAVGRYLVRLSGVYNGTQPGFVVNWSGGHSIRRPSSWRTGSQCSAMISSGSVSLQVA